MKRSAFPASRSTAILDLSGRTNASRTPGAAALTAGMSSGARMSIAEVAPSMGYFSESAFGATFKRAIGRPPRQYVREANL